MAWNIGKTIKLLPGLRVRLTPKRLSAILGIPNFNYSLPLYERKQHKRGKGMPTDDEFEGAAIKNDRLKKITEREEAEEEETDPNLRNIVHGLWERQNAASGRGLPLTDRNRICGMLTLMKATFTLCEAEEITSASFAGWDKKEKMRTCIVVLDGLPCNDHKDGYTLIFGFDQAGTLVDMGGWGP